MNKRTGDIHRQEFLNTFRHTSGFWLWPLSFLWLPRETFAFFGRLKRIRWNQLKKYNSISVMHLLSPMPRQMHYPDGEEPWYRTPTAKAVGNAVLGLVTLVLCLTLLVLMMAL